MTILTPEQQAELKEACRKAIEKYNFSHSTALVADSFLHIKDNVVTIPHTLSPTHAQSVSKFWIAAIGEFTQIKFKLDLHVEGKPGFQTYLS